MSEPLGPPVRLAFGPTVPALAAGALSVAYVSAIPPLYAIVGAGVGVGASVLLRGARSEELRAAFPLPALGALSALSLFVGVAAFPLLLVALTGAAYVAWLADDPFRPAGGLARGASVWSVALLGSVLAWSAGFLLPASAASLGVAAALAAGSVGILAYLVSRPDLFDHDAAATI